MSAMEKLTENDAQILRVVRARGRATADELTEALPKVDAVPLRVEKMAKQEQEYARGCARVLPNTSYLVPDGDGYVLTDLGRAALQDYDTEKREQWRSTMLKSVWLPLLVAFLTSLITTLAVFAQKVMQLRLR